MDTRTSNADMSNEVVYKADGKIELEPVNDEQKTKYKTKSGRSLSESLTKAHRDDIRANRIEMCGYITLGILIIAYFIYQVIIYADTTTNSITRSAFDNIEYYDAPYFFIYGSGFLYNLSFPEIAISGNGSMPSNEVIVVGYEDFVAGESNAESWVMIDLSGTFDVGNFTVGTYAILLFPPTGTVISVTDSLYIFVGCIALDSPIVPDNDGSYNNELIQQYTDGEDYALYWFADSIDNLGGNITGIETRLKKLGTQFSFVSTVNRAHLSLFEEKNEIEGTDEVFFNANVYSTLLASNYTTYDSNTQIWSYYTGFIFSYDPSGGAYKTVITTSKLKSFFDVLSNTGGMFGPIDSAIGLLTLWLIFGLRICGRSCFGYAPLKRLDDTTKQQIQIYLEEIGLIDCEVQENGNMVVKPKIYS